MEICTNSSLRHIVINALLKFLYSQVSTVLRQRSRLLMEKFGRRRSFITWAEKYTETCQGSLLVSIRHLHFLFCNHTVPVPLYNFVVVVVVVTPLSIAHLNRFFCGIWEILIGDLEHAWVPVYYVLKIGCRFYWFDMVHCHVLVIISTLG